MPWVGFEPTMSAGERPKTYALDRTATGTGLKYIRTVSNIRLIISAKRLISSDAVRFEFLKAVVTNIEVAICNLYFNVITSLPKNLRHY